MKQETSQKDFLYVLIFALGFMIGGVGVSMVDISTSQTKTEAHSHSSDLLHTHESMEHTTFDVSAWQNTPSVDILVIKDPKSGWNLWVDVANFTFAPQSSSLPNIEGEGHAHLYIDGEKITRLYGEWFHIPELASGKHVITVDLTTNDHMILVSGGEKIMDSEIVVVG